MPRKRLQRLFMLALVGLAACGDSPAANSVDASLSDTVADAAPAGDGAVVQCQADHQEALDAKNDRIVNENNQVEPTGHTVSRQGGFELCGELDPQYESGIFADVDVFEFDVASDSNVRVELVLDRPHQQGAVELLLLSADGPSTVSEAQAFGTFALTQRQVASGTYWVAVLAKAPLAGNTPVPYSIRLSIDSVDCEFEDVAETYVESLDGDAHRDNDAVGIHYEDGVGFQRTASPEDDAEPTELLVSEQDVVSLRGLSANVQPLDDYRDRDAYRIHTGTETRELSLRGSWPHDVGVDLDIHVFLANEPELDFSFGGAARVGVGADEVTTMAVLPDRDYWIWVGAYDNSSPKLPVEYEVALCGKRP